mgnify:CR=1 FL=1
MEEQNKVFMLDDKEFNVDNINNESKYLLTQLKILASDKEQIHSRLDIIETAEMGFIERLRDALNEEPEEVVEEEEA